MNGVFGENKLSSILLTIDEQFPWSRSRKPDNRNQISENARWDFPELTLSRATEPLFNSGSRLWFRVGGFRQKWSNASMGCRCTGWWRVRSIVKGRRGRERVWKAGAKEKDESDRWLTNSRRKRKHTRRWLLIRKESPKPSSSWATLILLLRFETVHARDRRTPFIRTPNELEHPPNRSTAVPTGKPDDVS